MYCTVLVLIHFIDWRPPDFAALLLFPQNRRCDPSTTDKIPNPRAPLNQWMGSAAWALSDAWSLVQIRNQESGWRLVIGDIDAVKIWTVSNVISQSENYFPIVFIHLCHSARHIIGTCINNISMFYTARVKCIAGLWEHVQWTFLVREKLFWSVI